MPFACDGVSSEEAANYHTAPGALPRSLDQADFGTRKRLLAMLRSRDPTPEAMENMVLVLQDGGVDVKVVAECMQKLSEWLRRSPSVAHKLCVKFKMHGSLSNVLARHAGDIDVARASLGALGAMTWQNSEMCAALTCSGALLHVYRTMEVHSRDRVVLDNASVALWRLAERGSAKQVVKTGGVQKLLKAMTENPQNPFLQSNGCLALQGLLDRAGAEEVKAMREAAAQALAAHDDSLQLRRSGSKLLRWCDSVTKRGQRQAELQAKAQQARPKAASACPGAEEEEEEKPRPRLCAPAISLRDWLAEVSPKGELASYHRELCQNFDSIAHLLDAYAYDGVLAREFFEDLKIAKISHRRLIERWFEELLERQDDLSESGPCPYQLPDEPRKARSPFQQRHPATPKSLDQSMLNNVDFQEHSSDQEEDDGRPKGWAKALELLERVHLRESHWERTLDHLDTIHRRRAREEAESSDEEGEEEEITRACFNAAFKTCEEAWRWEEALALLEEMGRRLPPDEGSYAAALAACSAERRWRPALGLLARLRSSGGRARVLTYNAAIWSLETEGAPWERALDILEEMDGLAAGPQPSALTYTAAVNVFARHGQWQQALGVVEALRRRRLRPDVGTYRAIREADWGCDWPADDALDALDVLHRAARGPQ